MPQLKDKGKRDKQTQPHTPTPQSITEDQVPIALPRLLDNNTLNTKTLLQLQATIGNQAVQRLLAKRMVQRQDDGEEGSEPTTGDEAEVETDDSETEAELEEMQKEADELKGDETLLGEVIPITDDLLELANPGRKSEPKIKKKHRKNYTTKTLKGKAFLSSKDTSSISPDEIRQGQLGDCYLLAAMSAIAQANPQALKDMISGPKKDGSYDVTLYFDKGSLWWKKKAAKVINVKPTFPQDTSGNLLYASSTKKDAKAGTQLWPMLIEKAYAKHKGKYKDIEGGFGDRAFELMTGKDATRKKTSSYSETELLKKIKKLLDDGYAVTSGSRKFGKKKKAATKTGAISLHEYSVKSVDVKAKTISLRNPWGHKDLDNMAVADYKKLFSDFSYVKM